MLLGEFDRATQDFGLATPTETYRSPAWRACRSAAGSAGSRRKTGPVRQPDLRAARHSRRRAREAAADENPELLWGLRGGGGNFGVVTSFEYRLHEVGPEVIAGGMVHSFADAPEVFRFFADYVADGARRAVGHRLDLPGPARLPGRPRAPRRARHRSRRLLRGRPGRAGERVLAPLRSFGRPLADLVAPMPYTALQSGSDAAYPSGQHNYWKSHFVGEIGEAAIAKVIEHAPRMTSPLSSFYFQHLGGAIARAGPDTAAFSHRDAAFEFTILTVWEDPAEDAEHIAWARDFFSAMAPLRHRRLRQQPGHRGRRAREGRLRTGDLRAARRAEGRLRPDNVFHLNQNIAPHPA